MNTKALATLWNVTQEHVGTSGARISAGVLLGLYNGTRFPLDLTELRGLDSNLREAAFDVIKDDAAYCQMEVHERLNRLTGRHDFGQRFEHLAHEYSIFKRGKCKRDYLADLEPRRLTLKEAE
ncbi:MAG: hypothetical protein Q8S73_34220 [Deltaproteobacteria bacterium]|nr:hypothetical protein [Deltaproteobacteria bacterium]